MRSVVHEPVYLEEAIDRWLAGSENHAKPMRVEMELTLRCNFNCVHCYLGLAHQRETGQELSFRQIASILDQLSECGVLWLDITGGEPLLREDFGEIYKYAYDTGFQVSVLTNGSLIDGKIAELWRDRPPGAISVSVYGASEVSYDAITGDGGHWDMVRNGVSLLRTIRSEFELKTPIMTLNVREIDQIARWASLQTTTEYKVDPCIFPTLAGDTYPLQYRVSLEDAAEATIRYTKKQSVDAYGNIMTMHCRSWLQQGRLSDRILTCGGGQQAASVSPSGRLRICGGMLEPSYDLLAGSFREGFYTFLQRVRNRGRIRPCRCQTCGYRPICASCGPKARVESEHGEEGYNPYICEFTRLVGRKLGLESLADECSKQLGSLVKHANTGTVCE